MRLALLFPGQGAQYPGMGRDFADNYPVARETFEEADDVLGMSLSQLIFEGSPEKLRETCHSQLAIYVTSLAALRVAQSVVPIDAPWVCSGLSLGEYTALTASGRLSFPVGLKLVRERANAMQAACQEQRGSMAVVMGLDGELVAQTVNALSLPQDLWVANFNCPGQVVISGTPRGLEVACAALLQRGAKRCLPLQVSGAFHSGLMRSAEIQLSKVMAHVPFQTSSVKLVMNVPGDFVTDEAQVSRYLVQQVTQPVRWEQGVRAMDQQGVTLFLELGPGKTLGGMNRRIGVGAPTLSVEKIQDLAALEDFFAQI